MKEKKIDLILNIIESIICVFGVIVFTIAGVEVNEMQRFIFLIADFYCAIKLATCIDDIIDNIKNVDTMDTQALEKIMYWS